MNIIKSSFEIIEQQPGLKGIYNHIELAGRTCYRSTRPEGTTSKDFVDRMIKSKHWAMCEFGTVYLKIPDFDPIRYSFLNMNPTWTKWTFATNWFAITTNLRALIETFDEDALPIIIDKYLCKPTEYHEKRITVKFTTDQGILREVTRHRPFSYAVESTRYCNYSRDRFNNEITFIEPSWEMNELQRDTFESHLSDAESHYMALIDMGWKPQQARNVLPLATKCDIVMTGFISDWKHFFRLRSSIAETGAPHPDMVALIDPLYAEFINRGYIEKN